MNPRWVSWAVSSFLIFSANLDFPPVNMGIPLYEYSEYISIALSKVWGNRAMLPTTPQLWKSYEERLVEKGGYGKNNQFLGLQGLSGAICSIHPTTTQCSTQISMDRNDSVLRWLA